MYETATTIFVALCVLVSGVSFAVVFIYFVTKYGD